MTVQKFTRELASVIEAAGGLAVAVKAGRRFGAPR